MSGRRVRGVERLAWRLLAVASLGCLACSESGASFKTTVTAQGEGETNASPLWPLRLGARWGGWVVTEVRSENGEAVHVLATGGAADGSSTPTDQWPLLVVRDGAIYGLGTAYHRAATPILLVPATVRVGMKWETRTAGGVLLFSGSVDSRETKATSFGPRVVWGLSLAVGGPDTFDNSFPYPLREGAGVSPGRLIEGIGPEREDMVVPLDSQETSAAVARLEVTALGTGPMMEVDPELGFFTTYVSASIDAARQSGQPLVRVHGLSPFYLNPPGRWAYEKGEGCGVLRGGALEELPGAATNAAGLTACPDGAAVVGASQIREGTTGRSTGLVVETPECFPPLPCPPPIRHNTYSLEGIFRDPSGRVRVLGLGANGFVLGDHDPAGLPGARPASVALGYDLINAVEPLGWFLGPRALQARPEEGAPLAWITAGSGGRLGVGQLRVDDRLFWYRLEGGKLSAAHGSVPMPMRSVTAGPDGRDTLSLSPDGRVDRVEVTVDGIEVRPLGRLALPKDSWLAGGFVQGDDLIAVVQRGFVRSIGTIYDPPPKLGAPWLYRVRLPADAPVAPPAAVSGVRAALLDDDVLVCWRDPPAAAAADLTGWTLRGRPPLGVLPVPGKAGETCVLVAQDPEITGDTAPGVEAKVPGVGRVLLVPSTVERLETPRPASFAGYFDVLAAAGDDLYIAHTETNQYGFEYGDLGVPQNTRAPTATAPAPSALTPDNHGGWAVAPGQGCADCAQATYTRSGMTVRTVVLADQQARIVSAYNDGSAVARVKATLVRIAADGSTTTVAPIAAAGGDVAATFVSRTGAACSFAGSAVVCRGADGVVRTGPPPPPQADLASEREPLHETLDGRVVGVVASSTDPESMLRSFDIDPEAATVAMRDIPGISGTSSARCNWFPLGAGRDGLVCQRPAARAGLADVVRSFRVDGSGLHPVTIPHVAATGPFLRVAPWGTPSAMLVYRQRATDWEVVRVPSSLIVEGEPPACSNGVDDDRDGIEDLMDLGCADAADRDEANPAVAPECGDGRDNDGDQTIDFPMDPECRGAGDPLEGEPPMCTGACAVLNGAGTPKHVDVSSGGVIAARWLAATDTTLLRLEAYSGAVAGPAWVAIYAHDPTRDEPAAELARADFTLATGLGWQGAKFAAPVVIPQGTQVWWVFSYPPRAQPPYAESGTPVDVRTTPPGTTGWRHVSFQTIMMRGFCCEP